MLQVRDGQFWDEEGRSIRLRGINLSGDSKFPTDPDVPSHQSRDFWNTDNISFVDRPFPLEEADRHLTRITSWGYNVIRFVITWEAVEHSGPGIYDEAYISYVIEVLRKCGEHNLMVIMDPHQDVWSRYSGGSGAPYWTYTAVGIDPRMFKDTEAAIVHNTSEEPQAFPRMIWSTNYDRLAAATMFILFFAGRYFAPRAILNGQNIQDYLQDHFIGCMAHVAKRISEAERLDESVVIGWESLNEPSMSWLGREDLLKIPKEQHLKKGTCPTPFQAMLLGSGFLQEVEVWDFGLTGPKLKGKTVVDPRGTSIWYSDSAKGDKYGWHRDKEWEYGICIWAQHGVWDARGGQVIVPDYFCRGYNGTIIDDAEFLKQFWMPHFRKYKNAIRKHSPSSILFCQPPVLKIPPIFDDVDRKDKRIVYSPHFYDGMTLMNKTWNTWYNVDIVGVLRGRYRSPIFAVKFGLRAIRNCLRDQLIQIRDEGVQNLGQYPCLFSEIGIPFDLDDKKAYRNNDFSSQVGALDANNFALESANVHFTFWHYSVLNSHKWGDHWNGEDLSFYSRSATAGRNMPETTLEDSLRGTRAAQAFIRPAAIKYERHSFKS